VSDPVSGPNWFPQPPPKPLKATSTSMLFLGALAAVAVGAFVWTSAVGGSGSKAKSAAAPAAATVSAAPQSAREAFDQCMHSMGAGSTARGRGRFGGGGPSKSFRNAFNVCRSLIRPRQSEPVAPPPTGTTPAPIA
jgi:hypothetical protein